MEVPDEPEKGGSKSTSVAPAPESAGPVPAHHFVVAANNEDVSVADSIGQTVPAHRLSLWRWLPKHCCCG